MRFQVESQFETSSYLLHISYADFDFNLITLFNVRKLFFHLYTISIKALKIEKAQYSQKNLFPIWKSKHLLLFTPFSFFDHFNGPSHISVLKIKNILLLLQSRKYVLFDVLNLTKDINPCFTIWCRGYFSFEVSKK